MPNSFTPEEWPAPAPAPAPRVVQVLELWPLLMQCEPRRVMDAAEAATASVADLAVFRVSPPGGTEDSAEEGIWKIH
ncbi:hypothetical protein CDL15_Pgr004884 [Punica granatum]|uniref:Uncharacterized protein n=1 Tax=Punica granatum TaxID=22663 RepID=A0A218W8I9_PUNGR|nr:hypothetical protein CDL15_Pgr004884 [Punica granatum]